MGAPDISESNIDRGCDDFFRGEFIHHEADCRDIRHRIHSANFMEMNLFYRSAVGMAFRLSDQAINLHNVLTDFVRNIEAGNNAADIRQVSVDMPAAVMVVMTPMVMTVAVCVVMAVIVGVIMVMAVAVVMDVIMVMAVVVVIGVAVAMVMVMVVPMVMVRVMTVHMPVIMIVMMVDFMVMADTGSHHICALLFFSPDCHLHMCTEYSAFENRFLLKYDFRYSQTVQSVDDCVRIRK